MGYLHILKLKVTVESEAPNQTKNADVYAELIQVLDNRSESTICRTESQKSPRFTPS
jgi:hypothetical protein